MGLSCVIPLGPIDKWDKAAATSFTGLNHIFNEIIIVTPDESAVDPRFLPAAFTFVRCNRFQRSHQLNVGEKFSHGEFISFLHFDSKFSLEIFRKLILRLQPGILFYFHLAFAEPHPKLCAINSRAANIRADWLGLPFGDQCFTLDKKSFNDAGRFAENVIVGEDAEFIRRWRRKGFIVRKTKGTIFTSARKYREAGWLRTTVRHLSWTLKFWIGLEPKKLAPSL